MKKININNPAEVISAALELTISQIEDAEIEMKGRMPPKVKKDKEEMIILHALLNANSKDGPFINPMENQKLEMISNLKKDLIHLSKEELIQQLAETRINLDIERKNHEAIGDAFGILQEKWRDVLNKQIKTGDNIRKKKTSDSSFHGKKYQLAISILEEIRPDKKWQPDDFKLFKKRMAKSGNELKDTPARRYFKKITGLESTKSVK